MLLTLYKSKHKLEMQCYSSGSKRMIVAVPYPGGIAFFADRKHPPREDPKDPILNMIQRQLSGKRREC